MSLKQRSVLPGFGLTMGCTLSYLSLLVLIPLAGLFLKSATISWPEFWATVTDPQVVDSYKLSFGASLVGRDDQRLLRADRRLDAGAIFVLRQEVRRRDGRSAVRHADGRLGHRLGAALFDATAGSADGWRPYGIEIAYSRWGVMVALTFIGLPFVVRTLQPALEDMDTEIEEAAASLGATRWQTLRPRHSADDPARAADRLRAGLRPGAGRIRLGDLHFQQVGEGHSHADLHEAGAIRVRRSGGHRRRDARGVVRHVVVHQFDAMVEPALRGVNIAWNGIHCVQVISANGMNPFTKRMAGTVALQLTTAASRRRHATPSPSRAGSAGC